MPHAEANALALLNVLELGAWDVDTAREAVDVLEAMGRDAVPVLADALQRRRRGALVRAVAASLLGRIGGRRARAALRAAYEDADRDVARIVRRALGCQEAAA